MKWWLIVLIAVVGLGGCAGTRTLSESCASPVVQSQPTNALPDRFACVERSAALQRVAAVGLVRQTGSQTRTVGVPREFFVAMIVIVVLVALL